MVQDHHGESPIVPNSQSQRHCMIVVPTYNEAMNIRPLIEAVLAQGPRFDILVVDDNSPDGTGDIVAGMQTSNERIHLLRRAGKQGLGTAYLAGFRYALQNNYPYIGQMDADFSHQPHYLKVLLEIVESVAPVALGSRNVPGGGVENWSLLRKLISRGGSLYARTLLVLPIYDVTGGFKMFRASALRQLDLTQVGASGYAFQVEMNYRCNRAGLDMVEFPIIFPDRVAGQSKMSTDIVYEAALMVLRLRWTELASRWHVGKVRPTEVAPSPVSQDR